ncbi:hypothetical protein Phi10:1_gp010 [Cellulophaga phage phi10:1]|uniref:Uncharacterized protein n=1 Tax=Cellulophaga phage phi10:1 TaxID=1327981 RepID=R9ZZ08_9CAUD|nr:hypothetical protein Phi10:1_gp010 [Cellulophaga phage phi10:1]AGO48351.1 hypothetical protein Phi10:1_gp010 [Cellulophaga phage phi10:1]
MRTKEELEYKIEQNRELINKILLSELEPSLKNMMINKLSFLNIGLIDMINEIN